MKNWKTVRLVDICRPRQWPTISSEQLTDTGYPVYGANGIIGNYSSYTHDKPTILITCRGATCGTINVCEPFVYVTGNAMALDDLNEEVDRQFLAHLLKGRDMSDVISGSAQPQITRQGLTKIKFLLPPLAEQQYIARVLDQADQLRQQDQQLLVYYDALVQAVFVEMFGDLVRNEKGWKKQPLADFIDSERPITYGILMPGEDVADGVPYVRVVDIKGGRVLHEQVRRTTHKISSGYKRSLLVPGDLLISIRGHVGRMAITPKQLDGANITQDTARLSINSGSNPEFVRGCLESAEIQRVMKRYTKGVAVKGINLGDLRKIDLPLPPLPLQQKFATIVAQIEQQKAAVQQQQAHSEALFQSLLQQAFRGELGKS